MMKKIKNSKKKRQKVIISAQLIFLIGIFSLVYFLAPHTSYPKNNAMIGYSIVDFGIDNTDIILIDDNPDFSSAVKINLKERNTTRIFLEPGTYYWKAVGILESSVKKFTVISEVNLELKNSSLKNTGDVPLNITKKSRGTMTGLVILDVGAEYVANNTGEKIIYQGEQYDK
jgi:hypothetical protein